MHEMGQRTITTLAELGDIAKTVLSSCRERDSAEVLGLQGELGAGKTAFVKELGKQFRLADGQQRRKRRGVGHDNHFAARASTA